MDAQVIIIAVLAVMLIAALGWAWTTNRIERLSQEQLDIADIELDRMKRQGQGNMDKIINLQEVIDDRDLAIKEQRIRMKDIQRKLDAARSQRDASQSASKNLRAANLEIVRELSDARESLSECNRQFEELWNLAEIVSKENEQLHRAFSTLPDAVRPLINKPSPEQEAPSP